MTLDYLDLLHETQMPAIRESITLDKGQNKITPAKIKQEIQILEPCKIQLKISI
jgi:hypothetical protein